MKKALMLRSFLGAATLSLGSVALAGSAGATNNTLNMFVGTNTDAVTNTTISTWLSDAHSAPTWQALTDATNPTSGALYAAYLDCHAASNTDCTLRETVATSLVSHNWFFQSVAKAAIAGDLAETYGCLMGNTTDYACAGDGYTVGSMSAADAQYATYDLTNSNSEVVADFNAGPSKWGAYSRVVINFTQLKATYTISQSSGGPINTDTSTNLNIVGRGTGNTVITGDGDTNAFEQDNGTGNPNSLYLQDITFRDFVNNSSGLVLFAAGNATTTLQNVVFIDNSSTAQGTVYSEGTLNVTGGYFDNNSTARGGAIYVTNGDGVTITGVQFSGNTADNGNGGAVYIHATSFAVSNSSFDHNFASSYYDGSALYLPQSNGSIHNTTVVENSSTGDGAIYNENSTVELLNDTIVGNQAIGGAAGLQVSGESSVTMGSTLLLSNTTAGAQANCSTFAHPGIFTSLGGNVVTKGMAGGCRFGSHDKMVSNYALGMLGFHGGSVQTIPLVAKSVGTAFAPRATCLTKDARGVSRGTTGTCDAGAYQVTKK
jgi:predicted outer membrane repeat protein